MNGPEYDSGRAPAALVNTAPDQGRTPDGAGRPRQTNGAPVAPAASGTSAPGPALARPPGTLTPGKSALPPDGALVLRVRESGVPAEDRYRLEDLVRLLLEYRGAAPVVLEVATRGRTVRLDLPFVTVNPCPELHLKLSDLLGPGNVIGAPLALR